MNFEELTDIWNQNSQTGTGFEINEQLLSEAGSRRVRNSLRETKWSSLLEIFINYVWLKFLLTFLFENYAMLKFSLPTFILLFIAIYSITIEACKLYLSTTINHQLSIFKAQKKLEQLRLLEVFSNNALLLVIPLFFVPFIVVFAKGVIGIDVYQLGLSEREILMSTAGTFIVALVIVILLNLFPNKELKRSIMLIKELRRLQDNESST